VSTYAYVNPIVAVFLGWLILHETVTIRTIGAGAVIVIAVAIIISTGRPSRGDEPAEDRGEPQEAVA
jgi:drug/metabolite transporter (DMT)-like permease